MAQKTVRLVKSEFWEFHGSKLDRLDEREQQFWEKLNRLGWIKRTKNPEECQDVDATALLTDDEYSELTNEYLTLHTQVVTVDQRR